MVPKNGAFGEPRPKIQQGCPNSQQILDHGVVVLEGFDDSGSIILVVLSLCNLPFGLRTGGAVLGSVGVGTEDDLEALFLRRPDKVVRSFWRRAQ